MYWLKKNIHRDDPRIMAALPLFLIFLYALFFYLGIIRNYWVEFALAFSLFVYYTILTPLYGVIAFFVMVGWVVFRTSFCKTDYSIEKLNEQALKTPVSEPIPKNIIQIYFEFKKGGTTFNKYKSFVDAVKQKNPDYKYIFFDDQGIETFLKENYPDYWTTYQRLPLMVQKVDFFRYIAVYHYGGIYLDTDVKVLKPFDDALLNHNTVFPVDEYLSQPFRTWKRYRPFCRRNCYFLLGQYAFGANPKNPFIKTLVDHIHRRIEQIIQEHQDLGIVVDHKGKTKRNQDMELYVYKTTGPDYVTQCFIDYYNKQEIFILDNGSRQMLGNYAKHMYMGSWK